MYGTGVNPNTVTHAFTLADPTLAWLILNGIKRIENRNFAMRPGWYAVLVYTCCHKKRVCDSGA